MDSALHAKEVIREASIAVATKITLTLQQGEICSENFLQDRAPANTKRTVADNGVIEVCIDNESDRTAMT